MSWRGLPGLLRGAGPRAARRACLPATPHPTPHTHLRCSGARCKAERIQRRLRHHLFSHVNHRAPDFFPPPACSARREAERIQKELEEREQEELKVGSSSSGSSSSGSIVAAAAAAVAAAAAAAAAAAVAAAAAAAAVAAAVAAGSVPGDQLRLPGSPIHRSDQSVQPVLDVSARIAVLPCPCVNNPALPPTLPAGLPGGPRQEGWGGRDSGRKDHQPGAPQRRQPAASTRLCRECAGLQPCTRVLS